MLQNAASFSSFSVDDLETAKTFYQDVLGITVKDNPMGLLELHLQPGHEIAVYPKKDHTPASFTVLNFKVDNLKEAVEQLKSRGVAFETYTGAVATDENNISRQPGGPAMAWFKDPSGNIFSVMEE